MHGYGYRPVLGFGRPWTPAVRALILACAGAWIAQLLLARSPLVDLLALDTSRPLEAWRWVTYLFLHGGLFHLLFNMLALWMFGSDLEERLGTPRFTAYYFFTGVGAALSNILVDLLPGRPASVVLGASGAVFGLLLAYGVLFAERVITLLVFFVLPVSLKAKHFVAIFAVLELLFGMAGGDRVAHVAHLGGMLFGLLFLKTPIGRVRLGAGPLRSLRERLGAAARARDDRRLDELLAKVNEKGIGSLTDGEKSFLHRMSRRKRWQ